MAKVAGISASTVQGIWKAHGLSPHRWRHFKLSNDPAFAEKLTTIVGLYVDPPAHAVVLSVDDKSQIQALDRTQPGAAPAPAPAHWPDETAQAELMLPPPEIAPATSSRVAASPAA
ncbi:hypothetical protein SAMN04488498_13626 [Mesorhizobium albiziae]|uniref:Transposase n=1 Tax=Neomesorhizobium albiziae TaxID=335020 RepID=A0A1I4F564_9HYPH|nr:hypothetical protein SAMN04488498_13626 [Mesorhizobium albiziae]